MVKTTRIPGSLLTVLVVAFSFLLGSGCAGFPSRPPTVVYEYFGKPSPGDAWSRKIRGWQIRQEADRDVENNIATPAVSEPSARIEKAKRSALTGTLAQKYTRFRADRQRRMARELAEWIQTEAHEHYIEDGPIDHWATFEETLEKDGDDCDGLELLVFNLLRELGFDREEVYRSVVYRKADGQHHMVTLWFEDPKDPWVIDPTGAMTSGMPRMSDVPQWVPIKIFTEDRDYTAHEIAVR